MPAPMLEHIGEALYLTDDTGQRWRVHDAHFTGGKPRRVALGAAKANTRYFVSASGERRAYSFRREDSRALDAATLAVHFAGAGWVSRGGFDPNTR